MHYQDIGNIALNALLSLHSNKSDSKLAPKAYLRKYLNEQLSSNKLSPCVRTYFKGLLDRAAANPISFSIEANLTRTHQEFVEVQKKLQEFEGISLKSRLDSLAKNLVEIGYLNLLNFSGSKEDLPVSDLAILVWKDDYQKFDDQGELTSDLKIRVKCADLYPFIHEAYNSGLLLNKEASEGSIHDFIVAPMNNCDGAAFPITTREAFTKRQTEITQLKALQRDRFSYTAKNTNTKKSRKKRK
ncbi:DUF2913 family protein [Vibrio owensii]|uniref:DUF2913 family protein n=1 Tax=Vibrio harveyi group TaxID=717610 RepID=UPI003CC6C862